MFANSEWFHENSLSAIPGPRTGRGWLFYVAWTIGIVAPTLLLASRGLLIPEAPIWLGLSTAAFFFEVRSLRRNLRQRNALQNLYVIDDENSSNVPHVETEKYELQIK